MSSVAVLLTILLVGHGCRGNNFEFSELIERIYRESDSTSVYFFGSWKTALLRNFMKTHPHIPVTIFTFPPADVNQQFSQNTAILVVQASLNDQQTMFENLDVFIPHLKIRKFVITYAKDIECLYVYLRYFERKKFTNIFGVVMNASYSYLYYADKPLQLVSTLDPLPDGLRNLNGLTIRTAITSDIPRVFWYTDRYGHGKVGGYAAQVFISFLQKHNATFNVVKPASDKSFMMAVVSAISNDDIDISMNPYAPLKGLQQSYPLGIVSWTFMVPLNGYVDSYLYFVRPFSPTVWIFIGLTMAYIIFMDVLKDFCMQRRRLNVWRCFSRTFLTMLNMSAERPPTSAYRFHYQVLAFAFILVNLYLIHLTSFLTVFIRVKQYDSVQELIDNTVPVMMIDYEWHMTLYPETLPVGLEQVLVLVDSSVFIRETTKMKNISFAYTIGSDKAEFLISLQSTYDKPRFHRVKESLEDYPLGFLLPLDSPFYEILNRFIMQVMDTGLLEKWKRDAVGQVTEGRLLHMVRTSLAKDTPLTLNHYQFGLTCLAIGWTLAMVVFVVEKCLGRNRSDKVSHK